MPFVRHSCFSFRSTSRHLLLLAVNPTMLHISLRDLERITKVLLRLPHPLHPQLEVERGRVLERDHEECIRLRLFKKVMRMRNRQKKVTTKSPLMTSLRNKGILNVKTQKQKYKKRMLPIWLKFSPSLLESWRMSHRAGNTQVSQRRASRRRNGLRCVQPVASKAIGLVTQNAR